MNMMVKFFQTGWHIWPLCFFSLSRLSFIDSYFYIYYLQVLLRFTLVYIVINIYLILLSIVLLGKKRGQKSQNARTATTRYTFDTR